VTLQLCHHFTSPTSPTRPPRLRRRCHAAAPTPRALAALQLLARGYSLPGLVSLYGTGPVELLEALTDAAHLLGARSLPEAAALARGRGLIL
jgi:hypothetical protein